MTEFSGFVPNDNDIQSIITHPGRGGCGVGGIGTLDGQPSRKLVEYALEALLRMEHRGGFIDDTGDGAGILIKLDRDFFVEEVLKGKRLKPTAPLGVSCVFFPKAEAHDIPYLQDDINDTMRASGLLPIEWRLVPVNEEVLGAKARTSAPVIYHLLFTWERIKAEDMPTYLFRTKVLLEKEFPRLYFASFSPHTLVYKALANSAQFVRFFGDFRHPAFRSSGVVLHRRYSTNTFSNWMLAQSFRFVAQNGEINTIKANRNAVRNLESEMGLQHVLMEHGSDSADLDRFLELLDVYGMNLLEAITRMVPPVYQDDPGAPEAVRDLYQANCRAFGNLGYWDGPCALVALDEQYLAGSLDRMGLRPLRYQVTKTGLVTLSSEIGAFAFPPEDISEVGQLDPGEIFALDYGQKKVLRPREATLHVVAESRLNAKELAHRDILAIPELPRLPVEAPSPRIMNGFGWNRDRVSLVKDMAQEGKEPIISMGNDMPLAIFSKSQPTLFKYFKQIIAVVTNPPIDPLREGSAVDLTTYLGRKPVASFRPSYYVLPQYRVASPFLTDEHLKYLRENEELDVPEVAELDMTFEDHGGWESLKDRIHWLIDLGVEYVSRRHKAILILTDREAFHGKRLPVPSILLTAGLNKALVEKGLRRQASLIVESGEIQEGHDACVLLSFGADAVNPYLMLDLVPTFPNVTVEEAEANILKALEATLTRVMSKMGISTLEGYRGSQLFEAVGLDSSIVSVYMPHTTSKIGGMDLEEIYKDVVERAQLPDDRLRRTEDKKVYNKEVFQALQETARGNPGAYETFTRLLRELGPVYLRDLLQFPKLQESEGQERDLTGVIPAEEIIRKFIRGAAMSHGALNIFAHRAIAAAFNSFGSKSNSGEGGEEPARNKNGAWAEDRSRIRQVASGRFGVTAEYLVNADEIQIKIGQGAKPGEGGHLPGHKVKADIARIRRVREGITLISPPPHHDIYSIEDLAQLIYNLRQTHPDAEISVKIPTVTDIGTIAVGVAKAGADVIEISGMEGGTGAASKSSIEHAGLPLERGLTEVNQFLLVNGIRHRVKLRADGGLKTGVDVAKMIALGADEITFGTALMISEKCIMCRGCNIGNCPAGITTQDPMMIQRLMSKDGILPEGSEPELRYREAKASVRRYLLRVAEDFRNVLAGLGFKHPTELRGRVDLLEHLATEDVRQAKIDLGEILKDVSRRVSKDSHSVSGGPLVPLGLSSVNRAIVEAAKPLFEDRSREMRLEMDLSSSDRAVGATLAGIMAAKWGENPANPVQVSLFFEGYAGQGFGFAAVSGMELELVGYANDTVGEVMTGTALIIIRQPKQVENQSEQSIIGNAACYGATGGTLYAAGKAGQRLGVRNSGATIITEGTGKYAFEYMTGGLGIVLGEVGSVLGSGMTGGIVFIWDVDGKAQSRLHSDAIANAVKGTDEKKVKEHIARYAARTGSLRAKGILDAWAVEWPRFLKVVPKDYVPDSALEAPSEVETEPLVMIG